MGEGTWKVGLQVARGFYVFYQSKLQEVEIVSIYVRQKLKRAEKIAGSVECETVNLYFMALGLFKI